jgi:hypothetical protein
MSLARDAALEMLPNILNSCLLERIGATAQDQGAYRRKQDQDGLHPLILKSRMPIARMTIGRDNANFSR